MAKGRIIRLEGGAPDGAIRFLSDRITLADGRRDTVVTITRTGDFYDPRYGDFSITRDMLLSMVRNFDAQVVGQEIALDVAHRPQDGAAGYFRKLYLDGDKLRGKVELTPYGFSAVQERGYRYLSAEYHEDWADNEARKTHGPTLLGAALTVRPVIKRLDPVQLSEDTLGAGPTLLSDRLKRILTEEHTTMLKKLLDALRAKLAGLKLHDTVIKQLCDAFEAAGKNIADEVVLKALAEQMEATGKTLAEAHGPAEVKLSIDIPQGKGMTPEDIGKLLDDRDAKRQSDARKLAETRDARVKLFTETVDKAESLKEMPEAERKKLLAASDLITAEMTEEQVRKLAGHQITIGSDLMVKGKLAAMGWSGPQGSARISLDEANSVKALQEQVDRRLGLLDLPEARRYAATGGKLQPENQALVAKVLADFDRARGADLHREHKMLAGGDGLVSDVAVPAIFERTVIREALSALIGLQFVDSGTLAFASSAVIPYSYRDTTAAGRDNTRVYEGGAIARAGVKQTSDTAYPIPQKLSFEVSDELRYLTASGILNWDAVAENSRNTVRIISEDTERMIFNEVLRASHEYGATNVSAEDLELQADDAKKVFILAQFPVVRPRKIYDLQGNQVGSTLYPITVTYNSVARSEYDGTGTQAAGTYYVLDYDLGEIYLVNQAGAIQTPANATAYSISYTYTTNVNKFDTDLGSDATDVHWDKLLYRYGLRKSEIEDNRYHTVNFGLMSGTAMTQIEQAKQFGANSMRAGTDLAANGNLGRIKDVANYKTAAPSLFIGDRYAVLGERGITRFRMMKPWQMNQLENQKDANGRFTGKKEAYGDQFIVLHTPTPLKRAYSSILLYSASARVARAAP